MKKFKGYLVKISCVVAIGILSISTFAVASSRTKTITASKARQIALKKTGGGKVEEVELKTNRNKVKYYEVEIEKSKVDYEVDVNAQTGAVMRFAKDIDDKSTDYGKGDSSYGGDSGYDGNSGYNGNSDYDGDSGYGGNSGYGS